MRNLATQEIISYLHSRGKFYPLADRLVQRLDSDDHRENRGTVETGELELFTGLLAEHVLGELSLG